MWVSKCVCKSLVQDPVFSERHLFYWFWGWEWHCYWWWWVREWQWNHWPNCASIIYWSRLKNEMIQFPWLYSYWICRESGHRKRLSRHTAFSCINYSYWLMHSEHMFGNSYALSICCFRRLFKSYSKSKGILSEYKEAGTALWATSGGVMNSSQFFPQLHWTMFRFSDCNFGHLYWSRALMRSYFTEMDGYYFYFLVICF